VVFYVKKMGGSCACCKGQDAEIMGISQISIQKVTVRLARNESEVSAAQHLRYRVFYEEYAAKPTEEMARQRRDFDDFDAVADHLIVIDESIADPHKCIVGTYRLLRREAAEKSGAFYTSTEYDINTLLNSGTTLLELGRSCVLAEYRTRPVLQLLWQGITDYMLDHEIGLMFGCASLHGTDIAALSKELAYLHHYHLAPAATRPRALNGQYVDMNLHAKEDIDAKAIFAALPPLIKGYLRLGAYIGEGAVVDSQFNTIDVCIVLPIQQVTARYRKFYARKVNRPFPGPEEDVAAAPELAEGRA
jgi:L-ornithine Nalpha-acyltransferase